MAPVTIPAKSRAIISLSEGESIKIINTHGTQVVDTWAFAPRSEDSNKGSLEFKYLSMCHTRSALGHLSLGINDILRDNERQPMLTVVEDTSGGVHDMLFAACDKARYAQLGVEGYHDSCGDNLHLALNPKSSTALKYTTTPESKGLDRAVESAFFATTSWVPDPLNLFMNVPVKAVENGQGGVLGMAAPNCPKGGYVALRAEMDCVVVLSACPMDLTKLYETRGAEFEILPRNS